MLTFDKFRDSTIYENQNINLRHPSWPQHRVSTVIISSLASWENYFLLMFCIYFIHDLIIHVKFDHDNHHRRDTISCHHNQRFGGDEMQLPTISVQ